MAARYSRTRKTPLFRILALVRTSVSAFFRHIIGKLKKLGSLGQTKSPAYAAAKSRRSHTLRVKNKRRIIIAAAGLAAVIVVAVVLITTGSGARTQVASTLDPPSEFASASVPLSTPAPTVFNAMISVPVHTTISVSRDMTAVVIADIQTRLMELEYMDNDEADGIFGNVTEEAVKLFEEQHGLEVDGVVDQEDFDLLFSSDAQFYTITIGASNKDVEELQQRLYELGYMSQVTGNFKEQTEAAVKKFQERNRLTPDGKVGRKTREKLYSEDVVANAYSYGESSPEIQTFQKRLKSLGFLLTEPDGNFGADTKAAVKRFQEANGLIADGHIGPLTKEALMSENAQRDALTIGSEGQQVTRVQQRLKELGYMSSVTGYFGSATEKAVRNFQSTNRLGVDGKVGAQTLNRLFSSSARRYTASSGSSSSGSSSGSSSSGSSSGGPANITGANIDSFISVAESKLGSRYVRGAKGPNQFDCSGFVYWCLNQVGVRQGYMTSAAWAKSSRYSKITSMSDLRRGDIMVLRGHVAIVAGNGYVVDASASNGRVVKRKYTSAWWSRNFICGFRIF